MILFGKLRVHSICPRSRIFKKFEKIIFFGYPKFKNRKNRLFLPNKTLGPGPIKKTASLFLVRFFNSFIFLWFFLFIYIFGFFKFIHKNFLYSWCLFDILLNNFLFFKIIFYYISYFFNFFLFNTILTFFGIFSIFIIFFTVAFFQSIKYLLNLQFVKFLIFFSIKIHF